MFVKKMIVYVTLFLCLIFVFTHDWSNNEPALGKVWVASGGGWLSVILVVVLLALLMGTGYILLGGKR